MSSRGKDMARQGKARQAKANDTDRFDQVGGDLTWAGSFDNERVRLSQWVASCGNDIGAEQCQRQGWAQCQPWHKAAGRKSDQAVHKQQLEKHVPSTWEAVGGCNLF